MPRHTLLPAAEKLPSVTSPLLWYYQIVEPTKSERLAVGSDGNILRWAVSGKEDQNFYFIPAGNDYWYIMNKGSGHYLSVERHGNLRQYAYSGGQSQRFRLQKTGNKVRFLISEKDDTYIGWQ